jgi:hypothetical protein
MKRPTSGLQELNVHFTPLWGGEMHVQFAGRRSSAR